jgi:parvulin-like peptidyl-prolyl isomerase
VFAAQALAEDAPTGADEARRAKVFATVGSETIRVGELEDRINARSPYARARFAEPEVLREFADDQVKNELFYQGAEKLGYAKDPEVEEFLDQTIVQLFVRKEFEETGTPAEVLAADIAAYYKENPREFRRAEMRRARHILVASEEEARGILNQLTRSDTAVSFRAAAKEQSLDTETKLRGGDLLYFTEDGSLVGKESGAAINPTLAKAAFELERTGDLSEPIDLGDGKWSALELTSIRPERVHTLEQASPGIRQTLWRKQREVALAALLTELRAELKPEVYADRMDAIVLERSDEPIQPPNQ